MIHHTPVLPSETIKYLAPSKNENFIDATCGLGGHSKLILEKNGPKGRLLAIDQDQEALAIAKETLKNYKDRVDFVKSNFTELGLIKRKWSVETIDGILFDLGVSTMQLTQGTRGFSFNRNAELDMRMSPDSQRISAKVIVNSWSENELTKLLRNLGEEPFAKKIAHEIVKARQNQPITMTDELVAIIKKSMPPNYRFSREKHFATSTFRALRMAVNAELENIESGLRQALQILSPGGRLVVISFHSLEDRIVKNFFKDNNVEILTIKPIVAEADELTQNPSARSAKLRAARKINPKS